MRPGKKSDLISCLKELNNDSELPPDTPDVDGVVILRVQLWSISSYASATYPYIQRYERKTGANRVDIVHNNYLEKPIKRMTREKKEVQVLEEKLRKHQ